MAKKTVDAQLLARAVQLLKQGELVAFPTETVYGLGADARNPRALDRLFQAKGRPRWHPVIVHLFDIEQVKDWARSIPKDFYLLAEKFWPGPLTLIVKRHKRVLDALTGGQDTVGLRMPNHPMALALLRSFADGIAAPSANKFGRLSPTRAEDVLAEFGQQVSLVLDGGPCQIGIESTIVDLTEAKPIILRPGMISASAIFALCPSGQTDKENHAAPISSKSTQRASGLLPSHYAPDTALKIVSSEQLPNFLAQIRADKKTAAVLAFRAPRARAADASWIVANSHAANYARSLYKNLRTLDRLHKDIILVEEPPNTPLWVAIRDRLTRASHN